MITQKTDMDNQPGFTVNMIDGTRYFIPIKKFLDDDIKDTLTRYNDEISGVEDEKQATVEDAIKWANSKYSGGLHPADIEELFAGTEWGDFSEIAIKLPSVNIEPERLWETASITFTPIEDDQFVFDLVDEHNIEGLTIGSVSFDSSAKVILDDSGEVAGIVSCNRLV